MGLPHGCHAGDLPEIRNNIARGVSHGNWAAATQVHSNSARNAYYPHAIAGAYPAYSSSYPTVSASQSTGDPRTPIENTGIKVGEIIAWRMWSVRKGYLWSYSANRVWAPHEPMSENPDMMGDSSDCHIGIWSFKEKSRAIQKMMEGGYLVGIPGLSEDHTVFGSVKLWGKIIEHELGYRSQYASIVSIDDGNMHFAPHFLEKLRKTYGLSN